GRPGLQHVAYAGARRRAAAPANRPAGPYAARLGHGAAPGGALGGEPIEDPAPECGVGVGAHAAAKAPAPESRPGHRDRAARRVPAYDHRPAPGLTAAPRLESYPVAARGLSHGNRRQTV